MPAEIQAPSAPWASTGWSGWPIHNPCRASLTRPSGSLWTMSRAQAATPSNAVMFSIRVGTLAAGMTLVAGMPAPYPPGLARIGVPPAYASVPARHARVADVTSHRAGLRSASIPAPAGLRVASAPGVTAHPDVRPTAACSLAEVPVGVEPGNPVLPGSPP